MIKMEIKQTKDTCVEHLTTTDGLELEIMSNLQSAGQIDLIVEGHLGLFFGSDFAADYFRTFLRSSVSIRGKGRDGVEAIGKTPDMAGNFGFSSQS